MPGKKKLGVWIIGIYGEVASATILGAQALAAGYSTTTGLLTETGPFKVLNLTPFPDLVFGGHDIHQVNLYKSIRDYVRENRVFDLEHLASLQGGVEAMEQSIRLGTVSQCGDVVASMADPQVTRGQGAMEETVVRIAQDMKAFQKSHDLERVVVVNLSSAEPEIDETLPQTLEEWESQLKERISKNITASMLYAYAALMNGFPYINFTPSAGSSAPALQEYALLQGVPHYGNDGKTGETLIKTVLAPMFLYRNLEVMSWEGYNLLGNGDGRVLQNPSHKKAKLRNKEEVLPMILGYSPHSKVSIDYVPSLRDWKTAWDFIHFKGFLDTPMSIQFTWQGCDSILAAPLVLDLIRLMDFAAENGEKGLMTQLACFFKHPLGVAEQRLSHQYEALVNYVEKHTQKTSKKSI